MSTLSRMKQSFMPGRSRNRCGERINKSSENGARTTSLILAACSGGRPLWGMMTSRSTSESRVGRPWAWEPADRKLSDEMQSYWANFAKTGNPNGAALPHWPGFGEGSQVMYLGAESHAGPTTHREPGETLDAYLERLATP